jgi:hypothetical protein
MRVLGLGRRPLQRTFIARIRLLKPGPGVWRSKENPGGPGLPSMNSKEGGG